IFSRDWSSAVCSSDLIEPGAFIVVDGGEGGVTINPPAEIERDLRVASGFSRTMVRLKTDPAVKRLKTDAAKQPLTTTDGTRVIRSEERRVGKEGRARE